MSYGQVASGLDFDGTNDYIEIDAVAPLMSGATNFTLEAMFKVEAGDTGKGMILATNTSARANVLWLYLENGELRISDVTDIQERVGDASYDDGNWHHVAVTFDGTEADVYVDGLLIESVGLTYTFSATDLWSIGQEWDPSGGRSDEFDGVIDEVRIWNTDLCYYDITKHKECDLDISKSGLVAYYKFEQGTVGVSNAGINTLTDSKGSATGNLTNFTLNGASSNWVDGNTAVSSACPVLSTTTMSISGNGMVIPDGKTTTSIDDHTLFVPSTTTSSRTFTITNTGANPLEIVDIPETDSIDIVETFPMIIPVGSSSTFTVEYKSVDTTGRIQHQIEVISNDCAVGVYDFSIEFYKMSVSITETRSNSASFNGSSDYYDVHSLEGDMVGVNSFSVETWVRMSSHIGNDCILSCNTSGTTDVFRLSVNNGIFTLFDGTSTFALSPTNLDDLRSHHLAVTFDGINYIGYVDGVAGTPVGGAVPSFSNTDRWSIGQEYDGATPSDFFEGVMYELRVWKDVRTQTEIR